MPFPQYSGFELNDINATGVITSNIRKFSSPARSIEIERIARRPGGRLLNDEFTEKTVLISGHVIGNTELDLREKIDTFNREVTLRTEGQLTVSLDRSATAIVKSLKIEENAYNTDFVQYELECLLPDPFFYADQHTASFVLASGVSTHTEVVTISGSYYSNPTVTITVAGSAGETQTGDVRVEYVSSGEVVVWSGAVGEENLNYGDILQFDFDSQLITRNANTNDVAGSFADFQPGERNVNITFSGVGNFVGGAGSISYQPRYL